MWIFLSDAFLSIVEPDPKFADPVKYLVVRSRCKQDILNLFPKAKVLADVGTDYAYRAYIPRVIVANRICSACYSINYTNFKDSVKEERRHSAYLRIWTITRDSFVPKGRKPNLWWKDRAKEEAAK